MKNFVLVETVWKFSRTFETKREKREKKRKREKERERGEEKERKINYIGKTVRKRENKRVPLIVGETR
jgi:hypothetical protein